MNQQFDRAIKTSIQKMSGMFGTDFVYLVTGKVIKIDENAGTCEVEGISGTASTNIENVEFQTVVSDGILIVPKIDSEVKVAFSKFTEPFIVQYSAVDKIILAGDTKREDYDTKVEINCEDIKFNGGSNKGLVKVVELKGKLNDIENKINSIITTFNSHFHPTSSPGAPTAPPTAPISGTLTPTQQADIENPKIQH